MLEMKDSRIINLNFTLKGMKFDAAIDCDWELHCYDLDNLFGCENLDREKVVPVELCCFDHPDWDIRMLYLEGTNQQLKPGIPHPHRTVCEFEQITTGALRWIAEMTETKIE